MGNRDFADIIMDPVRMRIAQCLLLQETATVGQIRENMPDVPQASLYRHIKILEQANLLLIVEENRKRGAVERVYRLNPNPFDGEPDNRDIQNLIHHSLLQIMGEFGRYFEREDVDLRRDFCILNASTLMLSDEEMMEFLEKLGTVFEEYAANKAEPGRKMRKITFISPPL